jgi:hypothetical protein
MGYSSCPKCGFKEPFDDECPRCGVYVSKYLALQERRGSAGPWQGAAAPQAVRPPFTTPSAALPPGPAGPAAPSGSRAGTGALVGWVAGLLALGGVGYVVIVDWFGTGFHFKVPPGWQEVDDELTEQAVQGMCPRVREKSTVHAFYTLGGATSQTAMGIIEIEELLPLDDSMLAQLRGNYERAQGQLSGIKLARAERTTYGGRPAVEIQVDMSVAGSKTSMMQLLLAAERSTMVFVLVAPTDVFRQQIDGIRASLATLHPLPSGLRGKPWFKYSLRWLWVLAVLGTLLLGTARLRRG